jgi:glycosyltransferase involved in cell wall biosynthesis
MRVALNLLGLPTLRQGGAGLYARMLVEGLARELEVVVLSNAEVAAELRHLPIALRVFERPNPAARRVLGLAAALRDPAALPGAQGRPPKAAVADCDVVHYPLGFMVPPVSDRPRVLTFHDLQHRSLPGAFTPIERALRWLTWDRAAATADRIIAVSSFSAGELTRGLGIGGSRVSVVPEACSPAFSTARPAQRLVDGRYLLYPASPLPAKNHARLLAAFADVRARSPGVRLVLVGPVRHDWSAVDAEVQRLGLADAVLRLGTVPLEDLRSFYVHAAGLVFPSLYEGFGIPLVEAMTVGCPIAAADAASIPEVLRGGGLLFDPRDVAAIAAGMSRLLDLDQAARDGMVARARRIADGYSVERMVAGTIDVYWSARRGAA